MQTIKTTWKDSQGTEWSVSTTRNDGESLDNFIDRHDTAVDALQAEHPPA